jgi:hypothetical protein
MISTQRIFLIIHDDSIIIGITLQETTKFPEISDPIFHHMIHAGSVLITTLHPPPTPPQKRWKLQIQKLIAEGLISKKR